MSVEDFGNCFVNTVGGSEDEVIALVNKMGVDSVKKLTAYYSSLPDAAKYVLGVISGYSLKRLGAWIATVIGLDAAEVLILFLGGFSWGLLIGGFVSCVSLL
jgi:hypothetical protein